MSNSVTADAPGKINLYFEVGSLRTDGYHDVASVYLAVDLREQVTLTLAEEWSVEVDGNLHAEHLAGVPTGEDNLVVQASKQATESAGISGVPPLQFLIDKVVPVAGGMGGGSADAAAALIGANQIYRAGLDHSQILSAAAKLGADVPFAIIGGAAIGTDRGDQLSTIEVQATHWVLVTNSGGLSTPMIYRNLDDLRVEKGLNPAEMPAPHVPEGLVAALRAGDAQELAKHLRNDLQEIAILAKPELAQTISDGIAAGALAGLVSGSGPTVALLAENAEAAETLANRLAILGYETIPTHGPTTGARVRGL